MKLNHYLTRLLKGLEKKWVALSPDRTRVIDSASNLASLEKKVGNKDVVYMKVLPSDREFAF